MKNIIVTGGAGFIGSNLIKHLLKLDHCVACIDNLSTGSLNNIDEFRDHEKFTFIEGDILDKNLLDKHFKECDIVSHQAALGSVPRSIKDPILSNKVNVEGTLNVFKAAIDNNVERVIYAASSSTYGDSEVLPKVENEIGNPLSPYAVTKLVNEIYADVFNRVYGLKTIGLRYFNVFGPKQNPSGPYAAVIPIFIKSILMNESPTINGDGENTRDFTFVENAVDANIKAIYAPENALNNVYNIACGERTSLNELFKKIKEVCNSEIQPNYGPVSLGDVKHSLADISKAQRLLQYKPKIKLEMGIRATVDWFKSLING